MNERCNCSTLANILGTRRLVVILIEFIRTSARPRLVAKYGIVSKTTHRNFGQFEPRPYESSANTTVKVTVALNNSARNW